MSLSNKLRQRLKVSLTNAALATELADSVDSALAQSTPVSPAYVVPIGGSIQTVIDQAVADGHSDSNPAFVIVQSATTENISLTKGGVWLVGANGSGTMAPITITGRVTINGVDATYGLNHFFIANLSFVGPADVPVILISGTNPTRLLMDDVWVTASGSSGNGHCLEITNTGVGTSAYLGEFKGSHNGTGFMFHLVHGTAIVKDCETSGTIGIGLVETGASLNIGSGECDANATSAFDIQAGGLLTITRSSISNTAANSFGVRLLGVGAVAVLGEVIFSIPTAGTGRAVDGVGSSVFYYQYLAFSPSPNANNKVNPAITSIALVTAPSFS